MVSSLYISNTVFCACPNKGNIGCDTDRFGGKINGKHFQKKWTRFFNFQCWLHVNNTIPIAVKHVNAFWIKFVSENDECIIH